MVDTAQPVTAAETAPVDPIADAMSAFKVHLGQEEAPAKPRDASGRFASAEPAAEEIEAEAVEPAEAESLEEGEETDEAADEAQPDAVDLPTSWPVEHTEMWQTLPPEAQAVIAAREGQRDVAVNAKFQEAANVLKANEAIVTEANTNRTKYLEAANQVLTLVQPIMPDPYAYGLGTAQYNRDGYDMAQADYNQATQTLQALTAQRDNIAAQEASEATKAEKQAYDAIEATARPVFTKAYPDVMDPAKAPAFLSGLVEFAVGMGIPADQFQQPVTSAELHILAKARAFDQLQKAKAKVGEQPAPEPRKAQPAVRPGVVTSRSAVNAAGRAKDFGRLDKTGSIADGAAMWKHFLKE